MTSASVRPLVSFLLIAYNQEEFVREAVEGAFAQTLNPLEIILSDDCSQDRTFEIMREMVADYTGPHSVRLNRNDENLGLIGHVNRAVDLATGHLLVMAAGDDISLPLRVQASVDLWEATGRKADLVYFGYESIDGNHCFCPNQYHHSLEYQVKNGGALFKGATAAWAGRLWDEWGPIPADALAEDKILAFRAGLSGGIVSKDEVAVRYRLKEHDNDYSHGRGWLEWYFWYIRRAYSFSQAFHRDLNLFENTHQNPERNLRSIHRELKKSISRLEDEIRGFAGGRRQAFGLAMRCVLGGGWKSRSIKGRLIFSALVLKYLVFGGAPLGRYSSKEQRLE